MDIGSRRPLGAGASGAAMLAALPDFEIEPTLRKLAPRLANAPGQELERVREAVSACRALGYALVPDEPMGRIMGLAVTFANRRGRPQGTLSINGIPERFGPERLPLLVEALHSHARTVEQAMSRLPDSERHRARWAAAGGKRTERS
jgi:DNA-binding IclR family transcriptional regulator